MMAVNPSRVDYYQRYMEIIEAYNSEQDRTTIEKTFMDLMSLAKEMSEEEQRYVREGFSSDEELSIYDLLFSDNLSKADIDQIKKLSVELLKKIKDSAPPPSVAPNLYSNEWQTRSLSAGSVSSHFP